MTVAQYKDDVKKVYESGYAVAIGIWDSAGKKVKAGNTMTSSAMSAARRAGIKISFVATVKADKATTDAAKAAADKLSTSPAEMVTALKTANADLGKAIPLPAAADIVAAKATTTTASASDSSDDGDGAVVIIVVVVVVLLLLVGGGIAFCCMKCRSNADGSDSVTAKTSEAVVVEMPVAPLAPGIAPVAVAVTTEKNPAAALDREVERAKASLSAKKTKAAQI